MGKEVKCRVSGGKTVTKISEDQLEIIAQEVEVEIFTLTNELRFVPRAVPGIGGTRTIKVLQQKSKGNRGSIIWEDVPFINNL